MAEITASRGDSRQEGSCNGCSQRGGKVVVVELKSLTFRLCGLCVMALKAALRPFNERNVR